MVNNKPVEMLATIDRITTDREGESKVTMVVSLQYMGDVSALTRMLEKVVHVTVQEHE